MSSPCWPEAAPRWLAAALSDGRGLCLNILSSSFTHCSIRLAAHWLPTQSRDRNEERDFRVSGNIPETFVAVTFASPPPDPLPKVAVFCFVTTRASRVRDEAASFSKPMLLGPTHKKEPEIDSEYGAEREEREVAERKLWKKLVNLEQHGEAGGQ